MNFTERIKILIDVVSNTATSSLAQFRRQVAEADGVTGKLKATWSGAGSMIRQNAAVIGTAVAAAAIAGGAALYKMAEGAAETDAAFSALNQVVGESVASDLVPWAQDAANTLGLSENAAYSAATAFGMIGKNLGLAGPDLEAWIKGHAQLSADMAAFANTSPEQVVQDIRAAYAGSTETLQKYNIIINDQAIKNAILEETGERVTGTLTAQQKTFGINLLLMEKTKDMQGQFARESDELSGQQARFGAVMRNISDTIGRAVLPAITDLGETLLENQDAIEGAAEALASFIGGMVRVVGAIAGADDAIKRIGSDFRAVFDDEAAENWAAVDAFEAAENAARAFDQSLLDGFDTYEDVNAYLVEYGQNVLGLEDPIHFANTAAIAWNTTQKAQTLALEAGTEAAEQATDAIDDKGDADQRASFKAQNHAARIRDIEAAYRQMNDALSDRSGYLSVMQGFDDMLTAQEELNTARAEGSVNEETYARKSEQLILDQKQRVLSYIEDVEGIPPEWATEILTMVDEGKFAEAERRLALLERIRIIKLQLEVSSGPSRLTPGSYNAAGNAYTPNDGIVVGENGPEYVRLPAGSQVVPAPQTAGMRPAPAGPTYVTNVVQNFPAGTRPEDVIRAQRTWERRNGRAS